MSNSVTALNEKEKSKKTARAYFLYFQEQYLALNLVTTSSLHELSRKCLNLRLF